jgi:hypothetical protein
MIIESAVHVDSKFVAAQVSCCSTSGAAVFCITAARDSYVLFSGEVITELHSQVLTHRFHSLSVSRQFLVTFSGLMVFLQRMPCFDSLKSILH